MPEVHLLNPFENASGGSEWRSISLFELLAPHADVTLWALGEPHKEFLGKYPFRRIDVDRRALPRFGNLVIVGTYFGVPDWIKRCQFERIIVVHNISLSRELRAIVASLNEQTKTPIEVVCASKALEKEVDGLSVSRRETEPSWIDLERFKPPATRPERPFTIGRMSRDVPEKHYSGDPALYRRLADDGMKVRIMGGTCLRDQIGSHDRIELLPACAESAESFLHSLDAMLYRTADHWFETYGRSIAEGMACGVVPVAYQNGGYAEYIRHGFDGFLYLTDDEAAMWLDGLRADPELRQAMGRAARVGIEAQYGEEFRAKLIDFYTRKNAFGERKF